MKISGIYKIESDTTKKIYIGESANITKRKLRHFGDLKCNQHANKYLQRHFNKYGINDLKFSIIEELTNDREILGKREKFWIEFYKSNESNFGFNLNGGGRGGYAHTIKYENFSLVNLSNGTTENYSNISDFEERNNLYGRHKIREVLSGKRKVSKGFTKVENYIKITGKNKLEKEPKTKTPPPINSRKFKILNTETKEVISSENVFLFCKENGLNYICFLRVLNGRRKKYKNWSLVE